MYSNGGLPVSDLNSLTLWYGLYPDACPKPRSVISPPICDSMYSCMRCTALILSQSFI